MRLIEPNKKLFTLIYGQSGTGKTHLAATYCWMYPERNVLLVDVDQGSATLKAKEFEKTTPNLFLIDFDSFKDLNELYELCEANTVEKWCQVLPQLKELGFNKPFDCVIIDTWTEMQWMLLTELRKRNGRSGKGLDFRQNIEIQHWQQMTDLNKKSLMAFKDLPLEFMILAQAGTHKDDDTGQMIKGPAIHGKLVQEMPAWFNTVIYTYCTATGGWKATTLPKMGWPAKIRGKVGKDLDNPTLKDLLE